VRLVIRWQNVDGMIRFDNALKALGDKKMRQVLQRGVARVGDMAKTQVIRALTAQTGLKRATIVKAVKVKRPDYGDLSYVMTTRGGDISLKYFSPRETRKGVSANPFGKRTMFAGAFLKGGRFPNRVPLGMGGHVFQRVGAGRVPIELKNSGVIIPAEMVKGATAAAFTSTVARVLPQRIEHEITRATGGAFS